MVVGLVFTSCNPLEEIYDEIDANPIAIVGDAEYTLTDDDYSELELDGGFETTDDVKTILPDYLSELYPVWGKGSSVLVNYNMVGGLTNIDKISNFINAENYTLETEDYAASGSDVKGFYPDITPSDYLDDILADNIEAEEGDIVKVKYIQYTEEPIITTTTNFSFEENFDYGSTTGGLTTISEGNWVKHSGTANQLQYDATTSLSMAEYPSSNVGGSIPIDAFGSEDVTAEFSEISSGTVYASTLVNLSTVADGTYFFHLKDYVARVGAKDDGSGKILFGIGATSFNSPTWGTTAFDLDTTYLLVASYDIETGISNLYVLSAPEATEPANPEATNTGNSGESISGVRIRQGWGGPTGTLDGIRVATSWEAIMVNDIAVDVQGEKIYPEVYYAYDGSYWNPSNGVYYLSSEDYDSMGTASGQPGKYNNFDSNVAPNNYIPAFLALENPFAQEEDELIVMYKYRYDHQTNIRGNLYTVIDGVWTAHSTSLQFGHDGNVWEPDNTIKYTLVNADYEYMSEQLESNPEYAELWDDLGYYHNFDYKWSDGQILYSLDLFLDSVNPTAEDGQKYQITYLLYDNGSNYVDRRLIKTAGEWVWNE